MAAAINHRPAHLPARAPRGLACARRGPDRQAAEGPGQVAHPWHTHELAVAGCSLRLTCDL